MKKLVLLAGLAVLLAACGAKKSETVTADAETPAQEAPASSAATPKTADLKNATQESAGDAEESAGDASLERMAAMPSNVALPSGRWQSGKHYNPIVPAQRTSAEAGQVEVLEFMWLGCPHCADLEPDITAWAKKKPAYIKFVQEHVMWGPVHNAHAKLLYTLQTLGRDDLVPKAFNEIHAKKNFLLSTTGNDAETYATQLAFAKANGISEADFKREFTGFTVNTRLQRADELTRRYRIESVPVVIINGKYMTDVGMAGGKQELLQLINDLAASEKGR